MTVALVFVASLATGVLFCLPRRAVVIAAVVAVLGYNLQQIGLSLHAHQAEAAFMGAFAVAQIAEFLARFLKLPAPVLAIPGIIPLVPGSLAYRATGHMIRGHEVLGAETAVRAVLIAVAIASGLLLASAISRRVLGPVFKLAIPVSER